MKMEKLILISMSNFFNRKGAPKPLPTPVRKSPLSDALKKLSELCKSNSNPSPTIS